MSQQRQIGGLGTDRPHFLIHLAETGAAYLHPKGRAATDALLAALDLAAGQRVLELGCGTAGTLVQAAAAQAISLHGLEMLPEMLRVAAARVRATRLERRIALCRGLAAALPLRAEAYDRVYCESVLGIQDARSARGFLAEAWRVLKPGGIFVANEAIWRPGTSAALAAAINGLCQREFGLRQASEQPWDVGDWREIMAGAGFLVRSAEPIATDKPIAGPAATGPTAILSRLVSQTWKARAYLQPRMLRQRARYRRGLALSAPYGRHIEDRLFILQKPPIGAAQAVPADAAPPA